MSPLTPPVIVLSGHRTGSSAVMGLLAASGLHLGELIPPSKDNPRGYFENTHVLAASRRMLGRRSRDWTCPPRTMHPTTEDLTAAEMVLDLLRSEGAPWGFKDPRTLFLLPAWLPFLPEVHFVGVSRPIEDVAASISRRDGLSHDVALLIASRYETRLRQLQGQLAFPVIEFSSDTEAMLQSVKAVVDRLEGLHWSPDRAAAFFDPGMVHHGTTPQRSPSLPTATDPLVPTTSEIVTTALARMREPVDAEVYWAGPAYRSRRQESWGLASRARSDAGLVTEIQVGDAGIRTADIEATETIALEDLMVSSEGHEAGSHVIGTDVLDHVAPHQLATLLARLADITDSDGVAVIGGFVIDGGTIPTRRSWPELSITAQRTAPPYLHHRTEIEAAIVASPWRLGSIDDAEKSRRRILLVKSESRRMSDLLEPHELRRELPELQRARREALDELATTKRDLTGVQAHLRTATDERDSWKASASKATDRSRELQGQIDRIRTDLAKATADASRQSATATEIDSENRALGEKIRNLEGQLQKTNRQLQKTNRQLQKTNRQLSRLRGRRSVRLVLAVASLARPLFRLVRRIRRGRPAKPPAGTTAPPTNARRATPRRSPTAVVKAIRALRPDRHATEGPLVSILILTRNGAHHLERLLPKLEKETAYRSFEVIVVDNGSTDSTGALLDRDWGFPLRVITNPGNTSFSAGNNQALAVAEGEHLLFLNNDIEPINEGWLGAMVDTLLAGPGRGAVGALLVYPRLEAGSVDKRALELTVQHRGTRFTWDRGAPRAINQGGGEDPTDPALTRLVEVPAATAACLLVRGEALRQVGGLDEAYVYGAEDVDFCLRLREAGWTIVECGEAALFHHESSTQDALARTLVRINRTGNAHVLAERWAPRLDRTLRLDLFELDRRWLEHLHPTAAITVTRDDPDAGHGDWYTAHEMGDALARLGWTVHYVERHKDHWYELSDDVDAVISLLDAFDVRRIPDRVYSVAWVRNWVERWVEQPWIDDYDLVLASSDIAMDIVRERSSHVPRKLTLATNPERFHPLPPNPTFVSDYVFTGNRWGVGREITSMVEVRPGERFLVFGKGWDEDPRIGRYRRGHLPYEHLPEVYSSTKIVLDDNAIHTKPYGAVNSRVFDALASGALVLSNNDIGSAELFDELLPTFGSRQELRALLDRYLSDDILRVDTAERLRTIVLDRYTYDHAAARLVEAARSQITDPRVAIKIGPPNHEVAETWGDTYFARQFARALRRQGFGTEIHILPEWYDRDKQAADVVVHLRGLVPYVPKPSHVNVLWVISHPEDVTPGEANQYDLVLVASRLHAERLRSEIDVPVHVMYQATDATQFSAVEPDPSLHTELLFVGNSRLQDRHGVRWAVEGDLPLTVYGSDWDGRIDDRYLRGDFFPNERLNELYCSADIVLNDHWPDMREGGLFSNRIFDALACGAFVISDDVADIDTVFQGAVPTYSSQEELVGIVHHYLEHPEEREQLARRGRELVVSRHTFDARAATFRELVNPSLADRPRTVASPTDPVLTAEQRT